MGRTTMAFAAMEPGGKLVPFTYERRDPGPHDIEIRVLYAGVCHSDIHTCRAEWEFAVDDKVKFPVVPGHEIAGRVRRVGDQVTSFAAGDRVGVGVIVNSCKDCEYCHRNLEQYCKNSPTFTYNDIDADGVSPTYGGYATHVVVNEKFVLRIPEPLPLDAAAPLLCAGITVYSPIAHWGLGEGHRVAVVGLGGLGHMAVQFAAARGAAVYVVTRSKAKEQSAKGLGAEGVLLSTDPAAMKNAEETFDFIIDTVSAQKDMMPYVKLLKVEGTLILVGLPDKPIVINANPLCSKRRSIAGSIIGGVKETQDMLNFCAEKNITARIERIHMDHINKAWERVLKSDVQYRFVIDIATSPSLRLSNAQSAESLPNT